MTQVKCVSPETALQILQVRWDQQKTVPVNLCGRALAVSPVIQVKDTPLFLIKLLPGVDIIIKKKELLQWHERLVPDQEYVISSLRPTTLQKGGSRQSRVYTVSGTSQLLSREAVTVELLDLQQWLHHNNVSSSAGNPDQTVVQPFNKLLSYQGTVTQVLDKVLGVFELDKNVRLHIGQVPALASFSGIQVGDTVTVRNAHHRQGKQIPKLILYGCMLCSLNKQQPETICTTSSKARTASPVLQKYLYLYELSQQKLDFLYTLRSTLFKQFQHVFPNREKGVPWSNCCGYMSDNASVMVGKHNSVLSRIRVVNPKVFDLGCVCHIANLVVKDGLKQLPIDVDEFLADIYIHFRQRGIEKIFTSILTSDALSWKQSSCGPYRNLLDEFLHSPHACRLSPGTVEEVLPEYVTVKEMLSRIDRPQPDSPDQWHCNKQYVKGQVLLGIISTCDKTGQCVLYDATAQVPIITCFVHESVKCTCSEQHVCDETCSCINLDKWSCLPCKNLHTCCRGKLVAVRQFLTVYETVCDNVISPPANATNNAQGMYLKYLCVNLKAAVILGNKSKFEDKVVITEQKSEYTQKQSVAKLFDSGSFKLPESNSLATDGSTVIEKKKNHVASNGENHVPLLHRHILEDGSSRFCRKTTCEATSKNIGKFKQSDSNEAKENVASEENRRKAITELLEKTFQDDVGAKSFTIKPMVRKVIGNCTVTQVNRSRCDVDLSKQMPSEQDDLAEQKASIADKEADKDADKDAQGDLSTHRNIGKAADRKHGQNNVDDSCVTVYVVNKEALRQDRPTATQEALVTCVDCIIYGSAIQQQLKVMLQGTSLRWYPCLYPGHVYTLTHPRGEPSLVTPHAANKRLRQAVERSNSQWWRVLHDEAEVEEVSVARDNNHHGYEAAVIQNRVAGKDFANIDGVVVRRLVVRRDQQNATTESRPNLQNHLNTRLDVQETMGGQGIQVYIDHGILFLPHGLIPGASVSFQRLERVTSRSGNIYYRLAPLSSVYIQCLTIPERQPVACERQTSGEPARLHLIELWKSVRVEPVFQCVCQVCQIPKLSLKCVCDYCGSTVIKSRCSNSACFGGESATLLARASVIVDDGTSVAMVSMVGRCVQSLLQLTSDQWVAMETETKVTGEVFVQQAKQPSECVLERLAFMLCDNRMVKRTCLMTLRRKAAGREMLDLNQIDLDEFAQKNFDVNSSKITTHCLPFLQLECVAMETFNPSVGSDFYLANM